VEFAVYVNGTKVDSTTIFNSLNGQNLEQSLYSFEIGRINYGIGQFYSNSTWYEAAFFNRALMAEQRFGIMSRKLL